jgi:diguanylate cyclase (GGDEF)-like protein
VSWTHDVPIRRKLTAAFALVSGGALVLATITLVAVDLVRIRRDAAEQLRAEAALIGANSSAAIAFRDPNAAAETLATLRAISDVTHASLYDDAGNLLARYARTPGDRDVVAAEEADPHHFDHGHLVVSHDVQLDRRRIGMVVLHSDLHSRYAGLWRDGLIALGIVGVAFALALLVATRLQRLISVPILSLLALAQRVSRDADYSLRARVQGSDEIGRLARGVNEMLETVQRRDRELADYRQQLEAQVAERTSDLARINEQLTAELGEHERTEARLTHALAELERHQQESEALTALSDRLQVCRDVAEVGPVIALYGSRLFPAASGSVHVFDEERSSVEPLAHWGEGRAGAACLPDDCWALRRGRVHAVPEPATELVCPHVGAAVPAGGYLCVPMLAQGNVTGFLHIRFTRPAAPGEPVPVDLCQPLAASAAERIAFAVASLHLRAALREQSVRDPLTGLYNRRYMDESLGRELARAARGKAPLAVVMLDLDHFKRFNDDFGHDVGDALLRQLGGLLQDSVRVEDIACRFGGEEFTLIMPGADAEVARSRCEQIRERVRAIELQRDGRRIAGSTVSLGVAVFPEHAETGEALLRAADAALYAAKSAGRDRVEVFAGDEEALRLRSARHAASGRRRARRG